MKKNSMDLNKITSQKGDDDSSDSGDNRENASNTSELLIDATNDQSIKFRDGKRRIGKYVLDNSLNNTSMHKEYLFLTSWIKNSQKFNIHDTFNCLEQAKI